MQPQTVNARMAFEIGGRVALTGKISTPHHAGEFFKWLGKLFKAREEGKKGNKREEDSDLDRFSVKCTPRNNSRQTTVHHSTYKVSGILYYNCLSLSTICSTSLCIQMAILLMAQ